MVVLERFSFVEILVDDHERFGRRRIVKSLGLVESAAQAVNRCVSPGETAGIQSNPFSKQPDGFSSGINLPSMQHSERDALIISL